MHIDLNRFSRCMVRCPRLFIASLLFLLTAVAHADAGLPPALARAFARAHVPASGISIYVQQIGAQQPLLAVHADTARNPASAMKLLSTLVALEVLGPGYTWKTEAYADGPVVNGRLHGPLYLKGYGDPYLVTESFWQLLRGLRAMGIERIDDGLVLDTSYLQPQVFSPAAFDGQPWRAYNTDANALLLNFQATKFRFYPDTAAHRLRIITDPTPDGWVVNNRIRLTNGRCRGWGRDVAIHIVPSAKANTVDLSGEYPASCGEHALYRVLTDAPRYIFTVFKSLWSQMGGQFSGGLAEDNVPAGATRLYTQDSPPLADVLRGINKFSNNVMARQLVLTLGAEQEGPPGTDEKGLAVLRGWLRARGLDFPELVLENGMGLSREERISARHLGQLLLTGYNSRYMPEFVASLPLGGVDGTLRTRFKGTPLVGRVHAKTGSLDGVKSLAGYLQDAHGRRWVVVFLQNYARADTPVGERAQDELLTWLYRQP